MSPQNKNLNSLIGVKDKMSTPLDALPFLQTKMKDVDKNQIPKEDQNSFSSHTLKTLQSPTTEEAVHTLMTRKS